MRRPPRWFSAWHGSAAVCSPILPVWMARIVPLVFRIDRLGECRVGRGLRCPDGAPALESCTWTQRPHMMIWSCRHPGLQHRYRRFTLHLVCYGRTALRRSRMDPVDMYTQKWSPVSENKSYTHGVTKGRWWWKVLQCEAPRPRRVHACS